MAHRWENTTDRYPFRFFSPEQVDQILRDGAKLGREGSHAAIERILKHELVPRTELWRRIRQLKNCIRQPRHLRSVWSSEDDRILCDGYQAGWQEKRRAVSKILKLHPDWHPHVIWKRAAKLHLIRKAPKRGQERSHSAWSEHDDQILLNLAGYKTAVAIAKMLHRSEVAVRYRLTLLGKSSRVHLEGFSRHALASGLHLGNRTIQRLIVEGLLEVRDPRITRESLDSLRKLGPSGNAPFAADSSASNGGGTDSPSRNASASIKRSAPSWKSRAKRVWLEVANSLGISVESIESLILRRILKLYDPRITEKSLRNFCRLHGSFIDQEFLNRETREWLQGSMDWVRTAGESASRGLLALRKHAHIVRQCPSCGDKIRGNVFFKHLRKCGQKVCRSPARAECRRSLDG